MCERDRRTRHWHAAARVLGPPHRSEPAAREVDAHRLRPLL
jgi:hypothetical protein